MTAKDTTAPHRPSETARWPKAYSYTRFSTPEQGQGDSLRRQTAAAREYATKNQLDLDEELTFHDPGMSAYRGRNAETGALGTFLEAVRDKIIPLGSYLLVESLDRISRQTVRLAMTKSASQRKQERIELEPDAWPRFERFIRQIAKAGPQHRKAKPKTKTAESPRKSKSVKKSARVSD